MKKQLDDFGREYLAALRAHLQRNDEASLSAAYELGRLALGEGWGVLDMGVLQQQALEAVVLSAPAANQHQHAAAAADFFRELLSPFEMSFRGYRAANDELRHLNETLRRQKAAVETVNRELESFSYSVSHDLRAPLRSIDGFSQALLEDYAGKLDAEGAKYLQYVRESAQLMGRLIDDLLGLAQVTRTELRRDHVDLSVIARRIAERLQASAPARQGEFLITEAVHGYGDAGLLAVLLENLLGNAWKFTSKRERARIEFSFIDRAERIFFVRDNGAGFDMSYATRLFGAFQRLHAAHEFEGTGIGLATVRRVVDRHGGSVWAESQVDAGATFYFTLGAPPGEYDQARR